MNARAIVRLLLAALILVALTWTYASSWLRPGFAPNPANFFGYFTVQSNLIGMVALAALGVVELRGRRQPAWLPLASVSCQRFVDDRWLAGGCIARPTTEVAPGRSSREENAARRQRRAA